ncbi:MAG: hypothetical protein E4H48_00375 [Syntrophobacterales bacterium]|nr:MAG: hypothetical protein E4H48_00375 [Syntrophobacterales bacterium]
MAGEGRSHDRHQDDRRTPDGLRLRGNRDARGALGRSRIQDRRRGDSPRGQRGKRGDRGDRGRRGRGLERHAGGFEKTSPRRNQSGIAHGPARRYDRHRPRQMHRLRGVRPRLPVADP